MATAFQQFKTLHENKPLLVLPNCWDPHSARILQDKGFPAIATSSHAVASSLGFQDGEDMSFEDYHFVIRRILAVLRVPLTVDLEMGYGKTNEAVYANIRKLALAGVAGINIEDSLISATGRSLQDAAVFAERIAYVRQQLEAEKLALFINIRCDTFLLNVPDKQAETARRLQLYNTTGADGIFLPCIQDVADIAAMVRLTPLPLNVMCIPGLPDFRTLAELGVKRASMGGFLFGKVYAEIDRLTQDINTQRTFAAIL
ncbi:isocitrate lyase/phosphoenolpyruvate mutase family protein [Chitinophaga sp. Mgbs1]|uniref:Isocitrate lyase/phosphoenolpyruvate mutase family protein n=1 Tax=Chitinophaga solisilvae TaxID=1233460 RepID=A0A9Q5D7Z9_9BACT|nr:isocitrate lyase/phosphoenolpyruvate mutase family protein [Chitinophaga solisilvae]